MVSLRIRREGSGITRGKGSPKISPEEDIEGEEGPGAEVPTTPVVVTESPVVVTEDP